MISIKKYLDTDAPVVAVEEPERESESDSKDLLEVAMDAYRSALRSIGRSAVQACPAPGRDLEQALARLESSLSVNAAPRALKQTQTQVADQLQKWGSLTEEHLKTKADEVKELLIMLARTAESVGERDQRYSMQIGGFTAELRAISNLDDLTQIRASLVRKATELKSCVDQMSQDGQQSLAHLRSKVSGYETKLQAAELLASKDLVTGLANRRSIERRMEWHRETNQTFCVVLLDLDQFKQVNDKYGHSAGDDLLKKFSHELQNNVRSEDIVGRWGGDEFVVVLNRDLAGAKPQVERIRQWVFGDYTIQTGTGKAQQKVHMGASVGLAQWLPGKTVKQVIEEADAAMYRDKKEARKKK